MLSKKYTQRRRLHQRSDLVRISIAAMRERGLLPEFSSSVEHQLAKIQKAASIESDDIFDLSHLLWCSIDNDDSEDLDQLTVSELLPDGKVKLRVAIADVDALVKKGTPIDDHARTNTTSVYTSARIFPMLPERLSTDLTSLNPQVDRLAVVTEMVFDANGVLQSSTVYRARVHNHAKLAYDAISDWIDGKADLPEVAARVKGMELQLKTQDTLAQKLRKRRRAEGSLDFETIQPRAVFDGESVVEIRQQIQNRARQLIEEVMIATNGCTARYLASHGGASLRRVVRSPERWLRIVNVAAEYGESLPTEPNSKALEAFLAKRRIADPLRFPDLSLVIVKLMGRGEYVVEAPKGDSIGHFGLAVRDYTHSTAPNRRYPDLITMRLLKAVLASEKPTYTLSELSALAMHCTAQEDAAQKVERRMRKSEAALLLQTRLGQSYDGVITGSSDKGVWVRIFSPPAEGKVINLRSQQSIGDKVRVRLLSTDVERGFIDFELIH